MIDFSTIQLNHMLSTSDQIGLNTFFNHTAFVISHKSEPIETLVGVLWHLPPDSTILVVTNCQESVLEDLRSNLAQRLPAHRNVFLIHQKDRQMAHFFAERGIRQILGDDQRVRSGKGEGMYMGALAAVLLGYPEWLVFYDADNQAPLSLVEYNLRILSAPLPGDRASSLP
jgi:mannosyl-3-phosphoglycerate synthase